jgi:hypothetical protein
VGVNDGPAAGQTIPHLHIHLIPRHAGDVGVPRGGVRGLRPGKALFLDSERAKAAGDGQWPLLSKHSSGGGLVSVQIFTRISLEGYTIPFSKRMWRIHTEKRTNDRQGSWQSGRGSKMMAQNSILGLLAGVSWAEILFLALFIAAAAGFIALILIYCYWQSVGKFLNHLGPKAITETVQILVAVGSIGGAFAAATDKIDWLKPAITGVVALSTWKILQLLADERVKAQEKTTKRKLEELTNELAHRADLFAVFRQAVLKKVKRLRKMLQVKGKQLSIDHVRKTLSPAHHLEEILEGLGVFFQRQLPGGPEGDGRNFRVGVYVEDRGKLIPVEGVSLNDPGYNPFSSFAAHSEFFGLNNMDSPSVAVRCVRERQMVIIEDCQEAATQGEFRFFNEDQKKYLRSVLAYFLGEVCTRPGEIGKATLVIDTEFAGFFKESDRDSWKIYLQEFAARIKLEMYLKALTEGRRKGDGDKDRGETAVPEGGTKAEKTQGPGAEDGAGPEAALPNHRGANPPEGVAGE